MFKKLLTVTSAFLVVGTSLSTGILTSCSSGASEEETQYAGYMTLADFASGRERFLVRNSFFRFFFINSDGNGSIGSTEFGNEILVTGSIEVDGEIFPASMIYRTNETTRPDGLPTEATLSVSLLDPNDASDVDLITAVFRDIGADANGEIKGEPIAFIFEFGSGLGSMKTTVETDFTYTTDDGNMIIGRDTSEETQTIGISVISSEIGPSE